MSYRNPSPKRYSRLSTPVRLGVVAVAACFMSAPVLPNPVNPNVVAGTASFNQAGNVLTVTNSNGAIINWDKFSIQAGETTRFQQAAASSSVLNRVLSDPTAIYGTLSSNGRVFLVNPAGILVGPGGRVDTAGFVASTLNIRNEDFLAGRNLFINDDGAKDVINQGEIRTPAGGSVYLIGTNVSNEGIITTPKGETILAAGATVSLIDSATPGVKVDITGAEGNVTNLGTITAEAGRIGIAGVIVRNSGTLNASSVVSEGGRIFLKASQDAYVDGNGRIVTTGTKGGSVEVLGNRVAVMDNAEIDASGTDGGGRIMVGGDYQGKNPDVQNASVSYFGPNASLKADATGVGDGGTVIVWSDDTTRAYGNISARGGTSGGDGGFVETSGKRYLDFNARVDTSAPKGKTGSLLLDPTDITIVSGPTIVGGTFNGAYGGGVFDGTGFDSSTIGWDTIQTQLNSTHVVIQTSSPSTGAAFGGSIFINGSPTGAPLTITHSYTDESGTLRTFNSTWNSPTYSSSNNLSLLAEGKVDINANFGNSGTGAITIVAGWDKLTGMTAPETVAPSTGKSINFYATLATNGALTLKAADQVKIDSSSNYAGIAMTNGTLDISANSLLLTADYSGGDDWKRMARIASNGDQHFTLGAGGLTLQGNNAAGAYGGSASIERFGSTVGGQSFTLKNSGFVALNGGNGDGSIPAGNWSDDCSLGGCSGNYVSIRDHGLGGQTFDFVDGGSLIVTAGTAGNLNHANIESDGAQTITSSVGNLFTISITGGTGGTKVGANYLTNDAGIGSRVSQIINTYGGALTMLGGGDANSFGGAYLGAPVQTLSFGNVILTGGASNVGDAEGLGSPVAIGNKNGADITLNVDGYLQITGGSGSTSPVGIGSLTGTATVDINATGDVMIDSGNSGVGIGSIPSALAAGSERGVYIGGNSSISSDGTNGILIKAGGSVGLSGNLTATRGGVAVYGGGYEGSTPDGGNIDQYDGSTISGANGVLLVAEAGTNNGANGNITQHYGGSIHSDGGQGVGIIGGGTVRLDGSVTSGSDILIAAGAEYNQTVNNNGYSFGSGYSGFSSRHGGNVIIGDGVNNDSGWISASSGSISVSANVGYGSNSRNGNGNITQHTGSSILGANSVDLAAAGSVELSGTVTSSMGMVSVRAGYQTGSFWDSSSGSYSPTPDGGNIAQYGGSTISGATGVDLIAYAGYAAGANGNIIQLAGSILSDSDIGIYADGNVALHGRVGTPNSLYIYAGLDNASSGNPYNTSQYGGNILLGGAGSEIYGSHVELVANRGYNGGFDATGEGTTGNITQAAGGLLQITGMTSLYAYAAGNVDLLGSIRVDNNAPVEINAGASYPGENNQYFDGKHIKVNSLDASGSGVSLYATGSIVANTKNICSIVANINGYDFNPASGGIEISNTGTAQPSSVNLSDNAMANSRVTFTHTGSDLVLNSSYYFSTYDGAGSIFIAAPSNNLTLDGGEGGLGGSDIILAAGNNLTMASYWYQNASSNLGLFAGNSLYVNNYVAGNNIALIAPTININAGVSAGGDSAAPAIIRNPATGVAVSFSGVGFVAGDLVADGSSAYLHATDSTGDVSGLVARDITLTNGAHFHAGNDVDLTLAGAMSTLSLSTGGHVLANSVETIHLAFTSRSSGGVMIDGVETTKPSSSGSGFFVSSLLNPVTDKPSLDIEYAMVNNVVDPCVTNPTLCKQPDKPPPAPEQPKTDPTKPADDPSKTTGGSEGTFGGDESGAGAGGEDKGNGKDAKKDDEKDKKDKKSDEAKDEKKDEKSGQKKVAQCGI